MLLHLPFLDELEFRNDLDGYLDKHVRTAVHTLHGTQLPPASKHLGKPSKKTLTGSNLLFQNMRAVRIFVVRRIMWEHLLFLAPDDVMRIFMLKSVRYELHKLLEDKTFIEKQLFFPEHTD